MLEQVRSTLREVRDAFASDTPRQTPAFARGARSHRPAAVLLRDLARPVLAGVAATVAVAAVIVGLAAGAQAGLATGHKHPRHHAHASAQSADAEAACKAELPTRERLEVAQRQATGAHGAPEPEPAEGGDWQTILSSSRGAHTILLFANAVGYNTCTIGPGQRTISGGERAAGEAQPAVSAGEILPLGWGMGRTGDEQASRTGDGQPFSDVTGRVGAGVSGVTLVLADGTRVAATIAKGWFLAWWPGTVKAVTAEVGTATGTSTQPLHDPQP
jgi:hypothetical protein